MIRAFALSLLLLVASLAAAADVSGTWNFEVQLDAGSGSPTFEFQQNGEKLTGKYIGMFGEAPLSGTVRGNIIQFTFTMSQGGDKMEVTYDGTIEGNDAMKGKANYAGMASGTFTARRKK